MRTFSSTLTLAAALALSLGTAPAFAKGGIYRFVEADGTVVYTNVKPAGRKATRVKGFRPAPRPDAPPARMRKTPTAFEETIRKASLRYKVPSALVRAVMHAESAFDPRAVSEKGACGLMQLMPATAREMFVKDIFEPRDNIEGGTRYLRHLANLYNGDMVKMVAAYNAGPDAVRRYNGKVPPYQETQAYVRKVLALYFKYKEREQLASAPASRGASTDGDLSHSTRTEDSR